MNRFRMRLVFAASACLAAVGATAAPVPDRPPASQGPISDYLRLRGKLPATQPPVARKLALSGNAFEVESLTFEPVLQERTRTVQRDGMVDAEKYVVTVPVAVVRKMTVTVKECKVFEVSKEGKLEPVEVRKAAELLKTPTAVLTGRDAEVDPRHLELVKPGTLYVVFPAPTPEPLPPPLPPRDEGKR